jgi:Flagellar FliJ protein
MSRHDLRGFEYALEPARQRAHHRVDAAVGLLGQRQQAVAAARLRVETLLEQCSDLARRSTPGPRSTIDPRRALAVSHRLLQLRESLTAAQRDAEAREAEANEGRRQLERARIDQQAFDSHHEEALQAHAIESTRREQAATDQDWLARLHVLRSESGERKVKA